MNVNSCQIMDLQVSDKDLAFLEAYKEVWMVQAFPSLIQVPKVLDYFEQKDKDILAFAGRSWESKVPKNLTVVEDLNWDSDWAMSQEDL